MAQKYWENHEKPIREKLIEIIVARAAADGITVAYNSKGIERVEDGPNRFPPNGIFVLPPTWAPLVGGAQPTNEVEGYWVFPVQVWQRGADEHLIIEAVGDLAGVVMDAVLANPLLDAAGGATACLPAGIDAANVVQGGGTNPYLVTRVVRVRVDGSLLIS